MNGLHIVDEGDHHIVLGHQDGHQVTVAKRGLSPEMMSKIQSLPRGGFYADGGKVKAEEPIQIPVPEAQAPAPEMTQLQKLYNIEAKARGVAPEAMFGESGQSPQNVDPVALDAAQKQLAASQQQTKSSESAKETAAASETKRKQALGLPVDATALASQPPAAPPAPSNIDLGAAPQAAPQPPAAPDIYAQAEAAMGQVPKSIMEQGKIQSDLANQQAAQYSEQAKRLQEINDRYQKMQDDALKDYESTKNDYLNSHIQPKDIFHAPGTSSKLAVGIGMILSGIGAGLSGQENMTQKMLNDAIERDVKAQELDLGKKKSLLEANYKRYQDLDLAKTATMNSYRAVAEAMMKQAEMSANSKLAAPRAAEAANRFRMDAVDNMQKLLQMKALKDLTAPQPAQPGQALGAAPAGIPLDKAAAHVMARLPKEQQSEAIKELGATQKLRKTQASLKKMYEDAKGIGAIAATIPKSVSKSRLNVINSDIAKLIMENSKAKGSEFSFDELVRPYQIDRTDSADEIDAKLSGILQNLQYSADPTPLLESLGVDVKGPAQTKNIPNVPKLR